VLRATFKLNDGRLRVNVPVVRKNDRTIWVELAKPFPGRFSKPVMVAIKRHLIKDSVTLSEG
jgi:hypothetical protein